MDPAQQIDSIIREVSQLPPGLNQIEKYEDLIRIADSANVEYLQFWLRMEFIRAATFSGFHERGLVAFSWCLAKYKENPEQYDEHSILWAFKWILGKITEFNSISKNRILKLQDEMEEMVQKAGYSLRPAYYMRMSNFTTMGDFEQANYWHQKYQDLPRDDLADCRACEVDKEVELFSLQCRDLESLDRAESILTGKMTCAEVPQCTYGYLVRPLIRLGRIDELYEMHNKAIDMLLENPTFTWAVGEHLIYLAIAKNLEKGIPIFAKQLNYAVESKLDIYRIRFFSGAFVFLKKVIEQEPQTEFALLSSSSEVVPGKGKDLELMLEFIKGEALSITEKLDSRNQNQFYSDYFKETSDLVAANS